MSVIAPPPRTTLFPYTTLFRSRAVHARELPRRRRQEPRLPEDEEAHVRRDGDVELAHEQVPRLRLAVHELLRLLEVAALAAFDEVARERERREIGRASCRERVWFSGVARSLT